jgi:hypothetical protein
VLAMNNQPLVSNLWLYAYHARIFSLPVEEFPFAHSLWYISKQLQVEKQYTYHQLE